MDFIQFRITARSLAEAQKAVIERWQGWKVEVKHKRDNVYKVTLRRKEQSG